MGQSPRLGLAIAEKDGSPFSAAVPGPAEDAESSLASRLRNASKSLRSESVALSGGIKPLGSAVSSAISSRDTKCNFPSRSCNCRS